jgi:hypothetical protein
MGALLRRGVYDFRVKRQHSPRARSTGPKKNTAPGKTPDAELKQVEIVT